MNYTSDEYIHMITTELKCMTYFLDNDPKRVEALHDQLDYFAKALELEKKIESYDLHREVKRLLKIPQYEQRSKEWFEARKSKLTSSDLDSVLGNNKYSSYDEVLFKKCGISKPFAGNKYTLHGQKYEDEAIDLYCKLYNKKTLNFGLLPHPTIPFLGGSPDDITFDGIVIEVKCPLSRKIIMGEIPEHYISQIKMNMEIANLDHGVFIEYRPASLCPDNNYILNVVHLKRDPQWLPSVLPTLETFWNDVLYYRKYGIKTHPRYTYFYNLANPKKILNRNSVCNISLYDHGFDSDEEKDINANELKKENSIMV